MKRSPLNRGASRLKRTPLAGGKVNLRRTRLKRVGKRKEREKEAEKRFRESGQIMARCAVCGQGNLDTQGNLIQAHHMAGRGRCAGHPKLHDLRNRAWLCAFPCHDDTHRGLHPHLIKSRDFLDTLD